MYDQLLGKKPGKLTYLFDRNLLMGDPRPSYGSKGARQGFIARASSGSIHRPDRRLHFIDACVAGLAFDASNDLALRV